MFEELPSLNFVVGKRFMQLMLIFSCHLFSAKLDLSFCEFMFAELFKCYHIFLCQNEMQTIITQAKYKLSVRHLINSINIRLHET